MVVGLLVTGPWDLGAVAQLPHILPTALLLAPKRFAGPLLDPLAHLGGVPHPSVGRGLLERFFEFLSLLSSEQRPLFSARVSVTTVSQSLWSIAVVTASELLDPTPGVSGDLHHLGCALAFADEPKDLVVGA